METDFWNIVKSNLMSKNSDNKLLQTWFDPTSLVSINEAEQNLNIRLGVPTELHRYWISENLFDRICDEIANIYQKPFNVELTVTGEPIPVAPESPSALNQEMSRQDQIHSPVSQAKKPGDQEFSRRDVLNENFTYSTFVVGRSNEFAHAASFAIAEAPGTESYNPLFICGPTGMGKTHLLNAVGNHVRISNPMMRICYVSAERFLNECISSIRRNEMFKFRQTYRERCDILLIDDIQFLGRGEAVQEEFFHTLNDLFAKRKQVAVASDRMPKDINGLEDRIRTRLEGGLIADIQMPDIETRVAILRYKAECKGLKIPDEVIKYIARISKRSIRELEGNLNKVKMFSELQGLNVDAELAKKVLSTHEETATISVEDIIKLCGQHFNVRVTDLKSKSRSKPIVVARQVCMFLLKKYLDKSLMDIGRSFGGKDHTTVINAIRRVEDHIRKDSDLRRDIEELEGRIHNITGV